MNGDEEGLFYMRSPERRHSLLLLTREDTDNVRKYYVFARNRQRAEKGRKEKL